MQAASVVATRTVVPKCSVVGDVSRGKNVMVNDHVQHHPILRALSSKTRTGKMGFFKRYVFLLTKLYFEFERYSAFSLNSGGQYLNNYRKTNDIFLSNLVLKDAFYSHLRNSCISVSGNGL